MIIERDVRTIVSTGARGLLDLWVQRDSAFKRSSDSSGVGSTSSPRATLALLDALHYSHTHPGVLTSTERDEILARLRSRARVLHDEGGFQLQRQSDINRTNSFTDSHLAIESRVLSLVGGMQRQGELHAAVLRLPTAVATALEHRSTAVAKRLATEIETSGSGSLADQDHDFVTYFSQRAIDLSGRHDLNAHFVRRVQASVLEQIGHFTAGSSARFDLGALVFGLALLQRAGRYNEPTIAEGLRIILECQARDGSWPMLRTISQGGRTLFISSYEVALALSNLLLQRLHTVSPDECTEPLEAIERVVQLASIEQREVRPAGWANDRNPARDVVEGWTTAIVLSLAVRYDQVLSRAHSLRCFARYDPDSGAVLVSPLWPDLHRFQRLESKRSRLRTVSLRISDPTEPGDLAKCLRDTVVAPILRDWADLPDRSGVSILLPGDPGTRKTTLVREVAKAVDWPVLTLSPPVFLRGGLEHFESEAAQIFRDLQMLSGVVVFFDECEEFFRKRPRGELASANRTVGAFITAGMLPRLQALHDRGQVVFIVATNALPEELDDAATRPGRFDMKVTMLHPGGRAQSRYLKSVLSRQGRDAATELVRKFDRARREAAKLHSLPAIPFGRLDKIAGHLLGNGDISPATFLDLASKD